MKKNEKAPLDANKKGRGFGSGNTICGKLFLGRAKHSTCYSSSLTEEKGTRGDDFGMPTSEYHIPEHKARGWR